MEQIIINETDSLQAKAEKTVKLWAGSSELKTQLEKLGVSYTKVNKGAFVIYVLRHKSFGRVEVKL